MKQCTIGMIGGQGKMGQCLEPIFKRYSHQILLSDGKTNEEVTKASDVLIFTVPIDQTTLVIESLLPHIREDQLLLDFTSVKTAPCNAMMKSKASVIGMHPMFGPSLKSIDGQTVVLCPVRPGNWLNWLSDLLRREGAQIIQTTPEKHDKMMAIVQCLVHFTSLLFSHTMKQEGINPKELFQFASPVYRMQLFIAGRIAKQSPDLYRDIQFENTSFPETLAHFTHSFETLKGSVLSHDSQAFENLFHEIGDFLGEDVLKEGQEMTNSFIELMKKPC